ncbi:winged helix-turn-helix domain-containing protein [Nocardia sp. CY41]|uniref:winged helix-turn-helix domain-containing protein n=1 Tax=Nocardia sp. CY41 TaxID=2608686 RepID=UPI001F3D27AC|nr:winged helix-turn-helix domain-containing protein [Nocardia sp. CY41]
MTAPVSAMPVWSGFLTPVLEVLADGHIWRKRDLHTAAEEHVGLTAEQRAEVLPSGQGRADNRIGWALSGLYRAKLVDKPAKPALPLLAAHPAGITEKIPKALPEYQDDTPERTGSSNSDAVADAHVADEVVDPLEQIERGVERLHSEVVADLLARLRAQDAAFLEHSVLDVLVAMGYGGTDEDRRPVGRVVLNVLLSFLVGLRRPAGLDQSWTAGITGQQEPANGGRLSQHAHSAEAGR